jgi:hypothetical protein
MGTHPRLHLGQTKEHQRLEEATEGTSLPTQALHIVEFLLKNGPATTSSHFRYEISYFRTLTSYQLYEDGVDRGAAGKISSTQSGKGPRSLWDCSKMRNCWRMNA